MNAPADESATPDVTETPPDSETGDAAAASEATTETSEKRPSRARDRIQDLVAQNHAAIEFGNMQKARADELEAKLQGSTTPAQEATRPKLADFDTPEAWADATDAWFEKRTKSFVQEGIKSAIGDLQTTQSQSDRDKAFQERLIEASEKHDDFWDVVQDPTATFMNGALLDTIKEFDNAGDIIYHLNSNPAEGRRIAALGTPARIGAAIGRLNVDATKPKPNVTEAPDPPSGIGSGPGGSEPDYSKMTTEDYIKHRMKERDARRQGAS